MQQLSFYPGRQFAIVRALVGLFFLFQFLAIFPFGAEMFSSASWVPWENLSHSFQEGPLYLFNSPGFVDCFLSFLAAASLALAAGIAYRAAALIIWAGLVSLIARNPLYHDFDFDYLGWLLLAVALVPKTAPGSRFRMPSLVYWGAWLVLAVSYSASGISKCLSPEWRSGNAMAYVLGSKIGRFHGLADFIRSHSGIAACLTWFVLALETMFLPLFLFARTRAAAWVGMTLVHVGIALTTELSMLSAAVLIFHVFVFDQRWLRRIGMLGTWMSGRRAD